MSVRQCVVFVILSAIAINANDERTFDVFGKIKSGFQMAGKILGLNRAKSVADLVSEAFGKTTRKEDTGNSNIFSGFLRVLGFDAIKISAIAVNAIIFVAQLISSSLSLRSPSQLSEARQLKGSPFDWMINNSKIAHLLTYANDKELPDQVIEYLKDSSMDDETGCIQLLICKTTPFVWSMQKAIISNEKKSVQGPKALFAYLPSMNEVSNYGDKCEQKYPFCKVDLI